MATQQTGADERTSRGRGGFGNICLNTVPEGMNPSNRIVLPGPTDTTLLLSNFVKISPIKQQEINQYRVDFEPEVESVRMRSWLFREAKKHVFVGTTIFDDASEVRAGYRTPTDVVEQEVVDMKDPDQKKYKLIIKHTGVVTSPYERLRIYNMHMKKFLQDLGFFKIGKTGIMVHPKLATPIGDGDSLHTIRGFNTAANLHRNNQLLMNFESVHKLMQRRSVLAIMAEIKKRTGANYTNEIKAQLIGKLLVTSYNKLTYRIEDVLFDETAQDKFKLRKDDKDISYIDYMLDRYRVQVKVADQPLLLAVNNTRVQRDCPNEPVKLLPELCNIAGLTESQKNDNRLKNDLIKSSQIDPNMRVNHLMTFLDEFHNNENISKKLSEWGYSYDHELIKLKGRVLDRTKIGVSSNEPDKKQWPSCDEMASFDNLILKNKIKTQPPSFKLAIIYSPSIERNYKMIEENLQTGLRKIGCRPDGHHIQTTSGDGANHYVQTLRQMPDGWAAIVIVQRQNKGVYDAIKKLASVDRGLITQVVTERLLTDPRKVNGASTKIGIQLAAKLGGEPWHVDIPIETIMVCGYDTYHDTANRGRSYGAFVASMNGSYSRWFSKADSHERLDELSSHLAENLTMALKKYHQINNKFPERIVIYRDGVGDGQLLHVHDVEIKEIRRAIEAAGSPTRIKLAFVVVNKRIGARFYRKDGPQYKNPVPGTVVDNVITREERFDFYLVSQSTRNGTLTPTYYNILANDQDCFAAKVHQLLAYKLCFLYFNWSGTVRVPAPCQYAHKLALLCGEHLHAVPHVHLDNRLHFL